MIPFYEVASTWCAQRLALRRTLSKSSDVLRTWVRVGAIPARSRACAFSFTIFTCKPPVGTPCGMGHGIGGVVGPGGWGGVRK